MDTVGERIKFLRGIRKVSRKTLARDAGIAYTTLADLELGKSKTTTALHRIAQHLKTYPTWLESEKGPRDAGPMLSATHESASGEDDPAEEMAVVQGHIVAVLAAIPSVGQSLLEKLEAEPDSPYLIVLKGKLRRELASLDVDALRAAARKARGSAPRKHR